jgi:hypothetical protein
LVQPDVPEMLPRRVPEVCTARVESVLKTTGPEMRNEPPEEASPREADPERISVLERRVPDAGK